MSRRTLFCLALLAGLLLPLSLAAQDEPVGEPAEDLAEDLVEELHAARKELDRFTSGLEGLHATFTQTLTSAEGELQDSGAGEVWMQRPDHFRWQYRGEFPELIVADGQRLWMYDETLEQVTVREQSEMAGDSPLMLLTHPESIDRQFNVTELGDNGEFVLLELAVKNPQAEFERVLLGLRDGQLRLMAMEDALGMRTEIRFDLVERNPRLLPELFRFIPPMGVDVIGSPENDPE
jgi:outer membrane lipoprotein carrier protein